jgi:hypothetical protein
MMVYRKWWPTEKVTYWNRRFIDSESLPTMRPTDSDGLTKMMTFRQKGLLSMMAYWQWWSIELDGLSTNMATDNVIFRYWWLTYNDGMPTLWPIWSDCLPSRRDAQRETCENKSFLNLLNRWNGFSLSRLKFNGFKKLKKKRKTKINGCQ